MDLEVSLVSAAVEVVVAAVIVVLAYKKPVVGVGTVVLAAIACGKLFQDSVPVRGTLLANGRSQMTAAFFAPGAPHDVLVQDNVPIPAAHKSYEVFVKVTAAGLNPSNFKINFAKIPIIRHLSRYHVVGYDFVGEVRSVGTASACRDFKVGDKIYGIASGSMAEFTTAPCAAVGHAPKTLSDVQIGGLPVAALTSLDALKRGRLSNGKKVLVIGASGGTGVFGVTIAKALGGNVTGICSGLSIEFVRAFGPDRIVDYTNKAEMQQLISEGQQFDLIYDTVTSFAPEDPDYEPSMRPLLVKGGKYIAINGYPMDWVRGVVDNFIVAPITGRVGALQRQDYDLFLLWPGPALINELTELFDSGRLLDVPIDSIFHLDQASLHAAFKKLKGRRVKGKIVITI